jgi:hypothetical protein
VVRKADDGIRTRDRHLGKEIPLFARVCCNRWSPGQRGACTGGVGWNRWTPHPSHRARANGTTDESSLASWSVHETEGGTLDELRDLGGWDTGRPRPLRSRPTRRRGERDVLRSQTTQELAEQLAQQFSVIDYDRRRGESGDTAPYAIEREKSKTSEPDDTLSAGIRGISEGTLSTSSTSRPVNGSLARRSAEGVRGS